MRLDESDEPARHSRHRSGRFELFYFEQVGSRTYLRFTRLTLFLIAGLTVLSILLLFVLFLSNRRGRPKGVDINVVAPAATTQDYTKLVLQPVAPGPTPPKVIKQPRVGVTVSPGPTPTPMPARTPT